MAMRLKVRRGDVVLVDLDGARGAEAKAGAGGYRACVVVQNDRGNGSSPLTVVVTLAPAASFRGIPGQVALSADDLGRGGRDSVAECGQVRAVDGDARLSRVVGRVSPEAMARVDRGLVAALGLAPAEGAGNLAPATAGAVGPATSEAVAVVDAEGADDPYLPRGFDQGHAVAAWPPRIG